MFGLCAAASQRPYSLRRREAAPEPVPAHSTDGAQQTGVPPTPLTGGLGGLTPMFTSGFDPWANSPFDFNKPFRSLPGTPGNVTPTTNSAFEFPSIEEAAGLLLSAKRKRRSSFDLLQEAAFMGTPLFSPNGTSQTVAPRPAPVETVPPLPVQLAPAPKGRRVDRMAKHAEEDEEEFEVGLDDDDTDYVAPGSHGGTPKQKRPKDEDDDTKIKRVKKSSGEREAETAEDMTRREGHVCQALQVASISEFFKNLPRDECCLVTVYPCKDPACNNSRKSCVHRVNRFQSTRNSKRHVHAYLYYKMVKGMQALVPDDTIRVLWKWLESSCPNGLKNANGHGKAPDGRTCINPYHYRLSPKYTLDTLPLD